MKRVTVALLLSGLITLLTLGLSGCSNSSHPIGVALTPSGTTGIDQAQTVSITASVTNDAKNAGVSWGVSGNGTLSGQTTTSATYNAPASVTNAFTATVTATSITDTTKSATLQIKVSPLPTITTTSLAAAIAGTAYSQTLVESGGTSPFTWSVTNGTLPPGLSLTTSTGAITGLPTGGGSGSVTFKVTDAVGNSSSSQPIAVTVNPPPALAITTMSPLPAGTIGTPYSQMLTATGGVPSYKWSLTAGSLPTGLSLSSAGVISGTPNATSASTSNFTVTVTDSQTPTNATQSAGLSITISIAPLSITTTSLPSGTVGTAYSATVNATGGVPSYKWSVSGNPSWLSIDSNNGVLSGTPTTAGTTPTFTVTVTDNESTPATAHASLSITINAAQACTSTNNTLLSGSYALMLNGWSSATTATSAIGSFVADGAGNITSASMDIADQAKSAPETDTFTGTYCVGSNNLATINLTKSSNGNQSTFEAAIDASDGNGHIIVYDTSGKLASGLLRKQDTTAFSTGKINGNYAFGLVGADNSGSAGSFAMAGEFNSNGSGALSGVYDADDAGALQTLQTISSSDFSVASTGRATAVMTSSTGNMNFVFYVVSASEMLMMAEDASPPPMIMAGQVLQWQSGSFTDGSLNGVSVIEDQYLDGGTTPTAETGLATADGAGSLSVSMDVNDGGTISTQGGSGSYSVDPTTGRMTLIGVFSYPPVFYLVGPNQAFLVGTSPGGVDFGVIEPQSTPPAGGFTNASLSGNYLGGSQYPVSANVDEEVDYVNANGTGTLSGTSDKNSSSGPSSGAISWTYCTASSGSTCTADSSGRVLVTQGGVQQAIIYIISPSEVVALGTQSNTPKLIDFHQ